MSFKVKFYSFAKKENSTAQPTGGTEYECQIKRESGILNPEIILNIGLTGAPAGWNYAYIAGFSRYYFIREWINEGPIWRALMQCDVLATYKAAIGGSTLYALRSSYSYDGDIVDALYPCKADVSEYSSTFSPLFSNQTGVFVCGIVCASGSSSATVSATAQIGSVKYFYMSPSGLATLCAYLLDSSNYSTLGSGTETFSMQDCSLELQKSLIDPLQYIKSCIWLPIASPTLTVQNLYINGWTVPGVEMAPVGTKYVSQSKTDFVLQKHPDAATRGGYLNGPGYTSIWMNAGPYGTFELDTNLTAYETNLLFNETIDVTSGLGRLVVGNATVNLENRRTMRGISIQLSQVTQDTLGAAAAGIGGVAGAIGAAMMGDIAGAIGSAVGGIANAAKANAPKSSSTGTSGQWIDAIDPWTVNYEFFRPVDDDNSHHGRPLCQNIQISNYPGYLLIQDADIAINATADELQKIRGYLEGGFYYE